MKVTSVPVTMGVEATIVMLTGRNGLTVIETVFEVAGVPTAHVALDVNTQVMMSLLTTV